jgi:hypothetical protein
MFVLTRLYRFYRRCGFPRRAALRRAIRTVARDQQFNQRHTLKARR